HADYGGQPGPMMLQVDALVDAGWLARLGDALKATRPLDEFRKADLPVSDTVRDALLARVEQLEPEDRELCELLALIDRPTSTSLLERCRSFDAGTQRRLDGLVKAQMLARVLSEDSGHEHDDELLRLADPYAARVI